jgi:hypothetical protein
MTGQKCREIARGRMLEWAVDMAALHSTPALALAVGHDHAAGCVQVFTVRDLDAEQIRALLVRAIEHLDAGLAIVELK